MCPTIAHEPVDRTSPCPTTIKAQATLRDAIGRRQRLDRLFSMSGFTLVCVLLTLLVVLFGQLLRDGFSRLTGGHLVKANGFAPGVRDLVGKLTRQTPADREIWELELGDYRLTNIEQVVSERELAALRQSIVLVAGEFGPPGSNGCEISAIRALSTNDALPFPRDEIAGRLHQVGNAWMLTPSPLPLEPIGHAHGNSTTRRSIICGHTWFIQAISAQDQGRRKIALA